jgi:hypothetical protein
MKKSKTYLVSASGRNVSCPTLCCYAIVLQRASYIFSARYVDYKEVEENEKVG